MIKTFKISTGLFITPLLLAIIASSCATKKRVAGTETVTIKTTATPAGATTTATIGPSKKEGIKKFSDVIPAKTRANRGLFTTYKVEGKYYYEIPDSLLGREMLVITRLVNTAANLKTTRFGNGSVMISKYYYACQAIL